MIRKFVHYFFVGLTVLLTIWEVSSGNFDSAKAWGTASAWAILYSWEKDWNAE